MNTAKVNAALTAMFRDSAIPEHRKRMPWPETPERPDPQPLSRYHRVGSQWLYLEDQLQRWYGAPMYVYRAGELVWRRGGKQSAFYGTGSTPRPPRAEWLKLAKRRNSAGVPEHLRHPDFPE